MPPAVGHYRAHNVSNPFNNFPAAHNTHAQQSYPHQNAFPSSNFNSGPNGAAGYPNGGHGFGSAVTNGGNFAGAGMGGPIGPLASQEAQMGFARGAQMQQQQQASQDMGTGRTNGMGSRIRDVWKHNLDSEMKVIRSLIDKYPYVSMVSDDSGGSGSVAEIDKAKDTEFPGVVARPMGNFPSKADYHYQCLRCNVDLLKLIQLGITLFSDQGEVPPAHPDSPSDRRPYSNNLIPYPCTWTFNFDFSLEEDMFSADSIEMLKKAGVDFDKAAESGINPMEFGSLLTTSGMVLNDDVKWLSFHSGYDFGYLVKIMSQQQLPKDEESYLQIVHRWFPSIYDIKFLFRHLHEKSRRGVLDQDSANFIEGLGTKSGLQDIADQIGCQREGKPHTAGSDAWLTGAVFWQMRQRFFQGKVPDELIGQIWGLNGVGPPASSAAQAAAMNAHTPATNGARLYHTEMTPNTQRDTGGPSTPQTTHSNVGSSTPGTHGYGGSGGLTGGVFSSFSGYGR